MIAFEVYVDGEKLCTASLGEFGVLTAALSWVGSRVPTTGASTNATTFLVGGLTSNRSDYDEFVDWVRRDVVIGEEITIRIVDTTEWDEPSERRAADSASTIERTREYDHQRSQGGDSQASDEPREIRCGFCGRDRAQVPKIITGSEANICSECVVVCVGLVEREPPGTD